MVLKGKDLEKVIDKFDAEAERNYRNYQESGISRYERAQHKAEDLADTLRVALNAVDEHEKLGLFRGQLHHFATQARSIKDPGEAGMLLKSIIALAELEGLIRREESV